MSDRASILDEINSERARQDEKYGGVTHDNQHTPNDWIVLITRFVGEAAARPACKANWGDAEAHYFRKAMVRVAALAIAAIEYIDRYNGEQRSAK